MMQLRHFQIAWSATRDTTHRWIAWVTLAVLLGLTALIMTAVAVSPQKRLKEYRDLAIAAWNDERWEEAELYLRKAVHLGDSSHETAYQLALIAEKQGEHDLARRRMYAIAPLQRVGYGPAHVWVAKQLLQRPVEEVSRTHLQHHLRAAGEHNPDNPDLHALQAKLHLADRDIDEAAPHLRAAVDSHPELAVTTARLAAAEGRRHQAVTIGQKAIRHYSQQIKDDPSDRDARLMLAELMTFLEQWADAERVLREGMTLEEEAGAEPDPRLPRALAKVYMFRADLYRKEQPDSVAEQLTLLELAVRHDPEDQDIAARLTAFLPAAVQLSDEALEAVQQHWEAVLEADPEHAEAPRHLGQVAVRRNRIDEAIARFASIAESHPELNLVLSRLHRSQGRVEAADLFAGVAEAVFEDRLEENSEDHQTRLLLAESKSLLGKWPQGIKILQARADDPSISPQQRNAFQLALSRLYTGLSESLAESSESTPNRIKALGKAIETAPGNMTAYQKLDEVIRTGTEEHAQQAREEIKRLVAAGKAGGYGHMLLGDQAIAREDMAAARLHFEQAHRLLPDKAEVANNLAWTLIRSKPEDAERALELIEKVVEKHPRQAEFLETRGEIYIRLGREADAISDLETMLRAYPGRPRTHRLLATAYANSGAEELAEQHRRLAGDAEESRELSEPTSEFVEPPAEAG